MNNDLVARIVRRAAVLAATIAVLGLGVLTVQTAAQWRADAAPLDAAPVAMTTINAELSTEADRTASLGGQIDDVEKQITDLKTALYTANGAMAGGSQNAQLLQAQMNAAKAKLTALQGQLKGAQARLAALNQAAARQAAMNAAARSSNSARAAAQPAAAPAGGGEVDNGN